MPGLVDKNYFLFSRDEHGEPLPQRVTLTKKNEDVLITPLTRGEVMKYLAVAVQTPEGILTTTPQMDIEIVVKHGIEPKFAKDELEKAGNMNLNELVAAIFSISGIEATGTVEEAKKKRVQRKRSVEKIDQKNSESGS